MKQSRSRPPLAILCMSLLFLGAAPVAAQSTLQGTTGEIAGSWKFKSFVFEDNCVMEGVITFAPSTRKNEFTCSFVNDSHCRNPGEEDHTHWRVKHACTAVLTGKRLQVTSRVERVEAATAYGATIPPARQANYWPDNFDVLIDIPGAQMGGRVFDPIRRTPVRLWREVEQIS